MTGPEPTTAGWILTGASFAAFVALTLWAFWPLTRWGRDG